MAAAEADAQDADARAHACPLCGTPAPHFLAVSGQDYFACDCCQLRFLHPRQRIALAAEHAHYRHHQNEVDDPGYRRFLSRLADPLLARLAPASEGLDFGCGPGPALAAMLRAAGHRVAVHDPLFAPDPAVLRRCHDFVTCTEVVEHFRHPSREFARLRRLVRPGGWLAIMTSFQTDDSRFAGWHYRRDPTHIAFYREATFRYLAARWGWRCEIPARNVALLQRPASDSEAERNGCRSAG
ncbi:MAG: class I SAM-dependent methyltransferase [Thermaurantiacus sp.]